MKVHPVPHKQKNLRRLPHIFSKVLELPFYSDADVTVQETSDSLKFVVGTDENDDYYMGTRIAAHVIEICPGVLKVVVRTTRGSGDINSEVDEMKLGLWRFRLPEETVPELATAVVGDGEMVVTVPKEWRNLNI